MHTYVGSLLCEQFPFGSPPAQTKVARGQMHKPPLDAHAVSGSGRDFIDSALLVDPNSALRVNRLTSSDACRHAWLRPHEAAVDATVEAAAAAAAGTPVGELAEAVKEARDALAAEATGEEGSSVLGFRKVPSAAASGAASVAGSAPATQRGAAERVTEGTEAGAGRLDIQATAKLLELSLVLDDEDVLDDDESHHG